MNSKLLIGAIALLLSACKPQGQAADGYYFELPAHLIQPQPTITVVLYPSEWEFKNEVNRRHIITEGDVFGFSVIDPVTNTCQINIVDPKVNYKPEELGHELTHCLYGDFHKSQIS